MTLTDARLQVTGGCEKLELAMLSFFEQFRKIYVGDQVTTPIHIHYVLNIGFTRTSFYEFLSGADDIEGL